MTTHFYHCSGLCDRRVHEYTAEEIENYVRPEQRGIRWPKEFRCPSCGKPCFKSNTREGIKLVALSGNWHDKEKQQAALNLRTPRLDLILIYQGARWEERRSHIRQLGLKWRWGKEASEVSCELELATQGIFDADSRIYLISRGAARDITERFQTIRAEFAVR